VSRYQKIHFAIFWIFWSKMKITQADAPTIWMDCHPIQTNWCPHLCHPHHFYAGCPSLHNPPNLSWLGTGTKYASLNTWWLGLYRRFIMLPKFTHYMMYNKSNSTCSFEKCQQYLYQAMLQLLENTFQLARNSKGICTILNKKVLKYSKIALLPHHLLLH